MAGITHRNGDVSGCVDSLLAVAFGAPGRPLTAAEAREQLLVMAMVTPMPDSLPEPATSRGAEGPYTLALEEHPFVSTQIEVSTARGLPYACNSRPRRRPSCGGRKTRCNSHGLALLSRMPRETTPSARHARCSGGRSTSTAARTHQTCVGCWTATSSLRT
jgi:hypothetical protein